LSNWCARRSTRGECEEFPGIETQVVRGPFRIRLGGLAASHSRYAFGDDFVITVRRSLLRFDRLLNLVLSAKP